MCLFKLINWSSRHIIYKLIWEVYKCITINIQFIYTDIGSIAPNENESSPLPINDGNIRQQEQIRKFRRKDLKKITNNLNDDNVIGKGGSGTVYLGKLKIRKQVVQVAVKMLSGQEELLAEVIIYPHI